MKKTLILLIAVFLLVGCERPATLTDWSPINGTKPAIPTAEVPVNTPVAPILGMVASETPLIPPPPLDWTSLPTQLPASMKGYELVSWQTGTDWNFTLVTGTNREKTFEELLSPESSVTDGGFVKITVAGLDEIKKALSLLPAGEEVYWSGMDLSGQVPSGTVYFTYPPQAVIAELQAYCTLNNIKLITLQTPE
jgi:hypothetical protein